MSLGIAEVGGIKDAEGVFKLIVAEGVDVNQTFELEIGEDGVEEIRILKAGEVANTFNLSRVMGDDEFKHNAEYHASLLLINKLLKKEYINI